MAIIKAAARLILREHERYTFRGPALCLGEPDFYLTPAELRAETNCTNEIDTDPQGRFVVARSFFAALGVIDVTSLDIPGSKLAPDRIHDLNLPLPNDLTDRFGLLVDPGTTEHVFDFRAGLTNIVRALHTGGIVIQFVPIYSYNGGYLSINPNVLHDFYGANGFVDIKSFVIMWDRYRPFAERTRCYPYGPDLEARHALADYDQCRFSPHLLLFARRGVATPGIHIPIQIEESGPASPPRTFERAFGRLARRVLPEEAVQYIRARRARQKQLHRSRRTSFWI
jgi:hypothetical protein